MAQLFVTITFPIGGLPTVDRTFQMRGNISFSTPANWTLISKNMSVQFGPGGQLRAGSFPSGNNWECTGTVNPATPYGSMVQVTVNANASFRFFRVLQQVVETLNVSTTFMVRLFPPISPTVNLARSRHRSWPRRCRCCSRSAARPTARRRRSRSCNTRWRAVSSPTRST